MIPEPPAVERKRMLALLIEDVTVVADRTHITAGIRWRGGQTSSIRIARNLPIGLVRKTTPEVIAAIDQLLESYSDAQAATRLNEMGYGNWRQEPFTYLKVRRLRRAYKLSSRYERLRARGFAHRPGAGKAAGRVRRHGPSVGRPGPASARDLRRPPLPLSARRSA